MDKKSTIDIADFLKIDLRIGTILFAELNPKAKKPAYRLKIDFGPLGTAESSAQITEQYSAETLIGKQVVGVVNFAPKNVAGVQSEVLVLASVSEESGVILLCPERKVSNGSMIA